MERPHDTSRESRHLVLRRLHHRRLHHALTPLGRFRPKVEPSLSMTIHCGNNVDFIRLMSDAFVHLTVTSPPYDDIRDYKGEWKVDLPGLARSLLRATAEGGMCAVVIQDGTEDGRKSGTTARMICDWQDAGWGLWETLIWDRPGTPGAWWNKRFRVDHEFIPLFIKGKRPRVFQKETLKVPAIYAGTQQHGSNRTTAGDLVAVDAGRVVADTKCRGTIWRVAKSNTEGNRLKHAHPATFPDALASDLIECFSLPGDIVFDPFLGSGTTMVSALRMGRRALGCDVSQEYCDLAKQRVNKEVPGMSV